jgi:hypothetical protein
MIIVRDVFQAKYGQGGELVNLFKQAQEQWRNLYALRILTDMSGSFFTVVTETEVESLAVWEQRIAEVFSQSDFGEWFARMTPLVDSGRREFYHIEA